jgi:16S rRNA (guanine(527)-N(7))-methyltransferase RsmG
MKEELEEYIRLLYQWNRRVRLAGVRDPEVFRRIHLGEVVAALEMLTRVEWDRAVDIGSGNGLVAVPLALAYPGRRVTALEPRQKKCAFLRMVKHQLGLANLDVVGARLGDYKPASDLRIVWAARALEIPPTDLLDALGRRPGDFLWLFTGRAAPSARVVAAGGNLLRIVEQYSVAEDEERTVVLARIRG